jgi:hypothetical protein
MMVGVMTERMELTFCVQNITVITEIVKKLWQVLLISATKEQLTKLHVTLAFAERVILQIVTTGLLHHQAPQMVTALPLIAWEMTLRIIFHGWMMIFAMMVVGASISSVHNGSVIWAIVNR